METHTYETSDLGLAAYLLNAGATLIRIDRADPQRAVFAFAPPKPELLSRWNEGTATVNVLAFLSCYSTLKRRLFRDVESPMKVVR